MASQKLPSEQTEKELPIQIAANGDAYSFSYSMDPDKWIVIKDSVDATFLSTKIAGGFVGCMYAMYATSLEQPSTNSADFDWFEYQGNDEIYRK